MIIWPIPCCGQAWSGSSRSWRGPDQLAKIAPDEVARITTYRHIIALRNILIHGYARVDHQVIWNVLEHSLPALRREVDLLMHGP